MKAPLGIFVAAALAAAQSLVAVESAQTDTVKKTLASVSALEMPSQAASLISQASEKDREAMTASVVRAAIGLNPAGTPAIVGAISRRVPTMAPSAAAYAASLEPDWSGPIAKAAGGAAPGQAGRIVGAMCREQPAYYAVISRSVGEVAPSARAEILSAATAAVPAPMAAGLKKASSSRAAKNASLSAIVDQSTMFSRDSIEVGALSATRTASVKAPASIAPPGGAPVGILPIIDPSSYHPITGPRTYAAP